MSQKKYLFLMTSLQVQMERLLRHIFALNFFSVMFFWRGQLSKLNFLHTDDLFFVPSFSKHRL